MIIQSALKYSFAIHTHIHTVHMYVLLSLPYINHALRFKPQLGVEYLAHGHFGMRNGGNGDQTANFVISWR